MEETLTEQVSTSVDSQKFDKYSNFDEEDRISISFNVSWGYKPGHGYMEDFIENKEKQANFCFQLA